MIGHSNVERMSHGSKMAVLCNPTEWGKGTFPEKGYNTIESIMYEL